MVRPGGRVVIVDKNAELQGVLEVKPWEQWFRQGEVCSWLNQHCTDVSSEAMTFVGEEGPVDGLFITWAGTRRSAGIAVQETMDSW